MMLPPPSSNENEDLLPKMKEADNSTSLEPLLLQDGDIETDRESHLEKKDPPPRFLTYRLPVYLWIISGANILLLIFSVLVLVFAKSGIDRESETCTKQVSFYSPALDEVQYQKVRFAGLHEPDSLWRGPPSPMIDDAWNNVTWKVPEVPVDEHVVRQANIELDMNSLARFPPEFGGLIYTEVEWKHHLHCLNLMRKFVYYDYYKNTTALFYAYTNDEVINHLAHCIDMLRQFVMCNADTGLMFSYWIEGHDRKHVDFNTEHVCRDFEQLLDYQKQNGYLISQDLLVRHPGVVDLSDHPENLTLAMMRPEDRNKYFL